MRRLPFRKLLIWQKSMQLAVVAYEIAGQFPAHELYGLTSQVRRSAVSVSSNIAEGSQRGTNRDFANFLCIARGSLAELTTQIVLAEKLGYIQESTSEIFESSAEEIARMLFGFHRTLLPPSG